MFIINVSLFNAALMWAVCIFAREDAAGFALSVSKEWSTARYGEAVENRMVFKLLSLESKMSPLATVYKSDFAYWVVSRSD